MKKLIICGDDLGYSEAINQGIFDAHKNGILTSAAAMVDGDFIKIAAITTKNTNLDVGLHVATAKISEESTITSHFQRQYDDFLKIFGKKPTHLSIHSSRFSLRQFSQNQRKIITFHLWKFALEKKIYLRGSAGQILSYRAEKNFAITLKKFLKLLEKAKSLPQNLVEIIVHPGKKDEGSLKQKKDTFTSTYSIGLRDLERQVLTSNQALRYYEEAEVFELTHYLGLVEITKE
jgi:hypothetical protein